MNSERFRFLSDDSSKFPFSVKQLREMKDATVGEARDNIDSVLLSVMEAGEPPFTWGPQEKYFINHCKDDDVPEYIAYRYRMSVYPRIKKVSKFPTYVLIEPASPCNLRCVMCFQIDKTFTKKQYMGYMDFDLYCDLIDQAAYGGTRAITFASRGEPLLHDRLHDMLRYAYEKKRFFDIKVNTNGMLLDEKMSHAILSANASIVVVSVDSCDVEQYAKIRVNGDLNRVVSNAQKFVEIREKHYPNSRTELRASGVNLHNPEYGIQDEDAFTAFWSNITDTVSFVDAEERWDTYKNEIRDDILTPCSYLFERAYIWYDGKMNPCDVDYKSNLSVGTIGHNGLTIADAWHSEAYRALRTAHLRGLRNSYIPCDRCGIE